MEGIRNIFTKIKYFIGMYKITTIIIITFLLFFCLYILGFRITYNPNIITDWEAVSAVGQWCSIIASIFVVYLSAYLTKKFDEKTKDIANSNRANAELMSEVEKRIDDKVKKILEAQELKGGDILEAEDEDIIRKRIFSYIEISIIVSTKRVADYIRKSIEETYLLLQKMENEENNIIHIGDNSHLGIESLLWKSNGKI